MNGGHERKNVTMKLFPISVAALFLTTGTAHAGRYNNRKCGDNITLQTAVEKVNPPNPLPVSYGFYIEGLRIPKARVTIDRDGQPRLNGKRCERKNENHELKIEEPGNFNAWREEECRRACERKNETTNP
jgi:hypothetical protein